MLLFANNFSKQLEAGDVLALTGPLGAGKTTFAKGVIHQLSGTPYDEIQSPTFTLVHEYGVGGEGANEKKRDFQSTMEGPSLLAQDDTLKGITERKIYHLDLYRLEKESELENLALDDLINANNIVLIEWADKFPSLLKLCTYEVKFSINENSRKLLWKKRI